MDLENAIETVAVPVGHRLAKGPYGLRAVRRGNRHTDARPRAVHVPLVVERNDDLDESARSAWAAASAALKARDRVEQRCSAA